MSPTETERDAVAHVTALLLHPPSSAAALSLPKSKVQKLVGLSKKLVHSNCKVVNFVGFEAYELLLLSDIQRPFLFYHPETQKIEMKGLKQYKEGLIII